MKTQFYTTTALRKNFRQAVSSERNHKGKHVSVSILDKNTCICNRRFVCICMHKK